PLAGLDRAREESPEVVVVQGKDAVVDVAGRRRGSGLAPLEDVPAELPVPALVLVGWRGEDVRSLLLHEVQHPPVAHDEGTGTEGDEPELVGITGDRGHL